MSKECKHEEWNPCGNDFYSCRKCGILRTSQQVNLYAEKDQQISDLEAKLAERGKEIAIRNQKLNELKTELHKRDESLQRKKQQVGDVHKAVKQAKRESARKGRQVCYANNEVVQYQKQIRQLKQQLAEKESFIEDLMIGRLKPAIPRIKEIEKQHQDKISFALEKLEKVKENIKKCNYKDFGIMYQSDAIRQVDNQIKQLKEKICN